MNLRKRLTNFIVIIFIVSNFILLLPNKSYGICNTVRFSKEISAVRLTLANGQILYDTKIDKKTVDLNNLTSDSYKNLNIIFVIETENGLEENKQSIKSFIEKVYLLYGKNENKVQIGIVPFRDLTQSEIDNRIINDEKADDNDKQDENNEDEEEVNLLEEDILKETKQDVLNEIDRLENNNNQTLIEAITIAQNNFLDNNGSGNDRLLQYMVLITDGIENGNTNVEINEVEQNVITSSNVILKDLSNENMVAMYAMLVGFQKNETIEKLIDSVYEMTTANSLSLENVKYQLENNVYDYISQYIIRESTIVPTSSGIGQPVLMSNQILLLVDEEILQGAILTIEYEMSVSRYSVYSDGEIYYSKFLDEKDEKLAFDENTPLLTEQSKTNASYEWKMTDEGLVSNSENNTVKLVLSTIITSTNNSEGQVYENIAKCNTAFSIGDNGETARYLITSKAMNVVILPPFGLEEQINTKESNKLILLGIIGIIFIISIIGSLIIKNRKK